MLCGQTGEMQASGVELFALLNYNRNNHIKYEKASVVNAYSGHIMLVRAQ